MIQEIKTIADVQTFFKELLAEDLNFHPDDDFSNYINGETRLPTYTKEEAELRNYLLDQAFEVCDNEWTDIYELCVDIFMKDFYAAYQPEQ